MFVFSGMFKNGVLFLPSYFKFARKLGWAFPGLSIFNPCIHQIFHKPVSCPGCIMKYFIWFYAWITKMDYVYIQHRKLNGNQISVLPQGIFNSSTLQDLWVKQSLSDLRPKGLVMFLFLEAGLEYSFPLCSNLANNLITTLPANIFSSLPELRVMWV